MSDYAEVTVAEALMNTCSADANPAIATTWGPGVARRIAVMADDARRECEAGVPTADRTMVSLGYFLADLPQYDLVEIDAEGMLIMRDRFTGDWDVCIRDESWWTCLPFNYESRQSFSASPNASRRSSPPCMSILDNKPTGWVGSLSTMANACVERIATAEADGQITLDQALKAVELPLSRLKKDEWPVIVAMLAIRLHQHKTGVDPHAMQTLADIRRVLADADENEQTRRKLADDGDGTS